MRLTLALLFALCLSAHGQAIRNLGGSGTNLTLYGSSLLTYPLVIAGGNGVRMNDDSGNRISLVDSNGFTGNGIGLTNILEANIRVATNTWGQAVINFALGTQVQTNMAGNLTLTGISGFNATNLNWQIIDLIPGASDRILSVPADWWVSGFTNATVVTIPTTNVAKLRIECLIGRSTNASIEIYQ